MINKTSNLQPQSLDYHDWFISNRLAILKRVGDLNEKPDGVIYQEQTRFYDITVLKNGTQILLAFDKGGRRIIESRMDLADPLKLLSIYTQMMMLVLVWVDQPKRIYVVGLGGGRLPMVLHHYLPETIIECAELDSAVVPVAKQYFGVELDSRFQVAIQDGRDYLTKQEQNCRYDIIIIDAFRESLYAPYELSTHNFYNLCNEHLTINGVILVNLMQSDPLFEARLNTIRASFDEIYLCANKTAIVVIGTNVPRITTPEIITRAKTLQAKYQFSFSLVDRAYEVKSSEETSAYLSNLKNTAKILIDNRPNYNGYTYTS